MGLTTRLQLRSRKIKMLFYNEVNTIHLSLQWNSRSLIWNHFRTKTNPWEQKWNRTNERRTVSAPYFLHEMKFGHYDLEGVKEQEGLRKTTWTKNLMFQELVHLMVTGVISSTVVTLSRSVDNAAVMRHRVFTRGHTLPFVIWKPQEIIQQLSWMYSGAIYPQICH
jgi:hypothetical protein